MAKKIKYDGQEVITKYAECDSEGNKISTTYAKKSDVPSTANFVKTTGAQNIAGVKTFTESPQIKSTIGDAYINFNTDYYAGLVFRGVNEGSSYQPSGAVIFDYEYGELDLYGGQGIICNGGLYEENSRAPYRVGYKYSGYISSISSATNKYYICFQFFDDKPGQSYISGRDSDITTMANLISALKRAGHTSANSACPASGKYGTNNVIGVYSDGSKLTFEYVGYSSNTNAVTTVSISANNSVVGTIYFTAINS